MTVNGRIPSWYLPIKEYGFQFGIAIFFLLPQLLNKYLISRAFEILVDGDVRYSKLNEGRMWQTDDNEGTEDGLIEGTALPVGP